MTSIIRQKLVEQYSIQDIPQELLQQYFISYRQKFPENTLALDSTIAFCIASEWQRGLSQPALRD